MKHLLISIRFFILLLLCSCTTPPNNGLLDGQWQIMDITTNADGTVSHPKQHYYAFAQKLVSIRKVVSYHSETGNMRFTGDSIYLDMPYAKHDFVDRFGMDSTQTVFTVDELTNQTLRIHGKKYTLRCRRF